MSLNLASIVDNAARYFPDCTALVHDERRLTYRELSRQVEAFAAHLRRLGVEPGERVALLSPNRMSFTVAYFGILHAGAVTVPVSYLAVAREVAYVLRDSGAAALVAWEGLAAAARGGREQVDPPPCLLLFDESRGPLTLLDSAPVDPDGRCELALTGAGDTAVILYTSGTTGEPKGAELTHFNLYSNAQYCAERLLGTPESPRLMGPGFVNFAALPLFHSFGQTCNQNASILGGAALTYLERFEPQAALEVMERDRVSCFSGVPTMYSLLLDYPGAERHELRSLRFCSSGGAAMPLEVLQAFEERYGVRIQEGYGLSETSPVSSFNVLWKPRKPGSVGEAIPGCRVRILDDQDRPPPPGEVGEVAIRGYNVMKGYHDRPEATAEALRGGWLHTGDMGRMDTDGYLYIVDRKKDVIIRGGFNVYPREVEEVLYSHPAVKDAAVVGVPDARYGEEVKACVALKEGVSLEDPAAELLRFAKEQLSASKYPRIFEIFPELPKGPTGKVLRKELRARKGGR